ncbi:MAG: hypothetical protein U0904_04755 [Candidatus Nanopelagicales bacterium]|nr:hypothetical protein [Candidatus Nanopelagicales bacterium]
MIFAAVGPWEVGDAWAAEVRRFGVRARLHTSDPTTRREAAAAVVRRLVYGDVSETIIDLGRGRPPYVNRLAGDIGPEVVAVEAPPALAAELQRVRLKSGASVGLLCDLDPALFDDPEAQRGVAKAAGVPVAEGRGAPQSHPGHGPVVHVTGVAASGSVLRSCAYLSQTTSGPRGHGAPIDVMASSEAVHMAGNVMSLLRHTGLFRVDAIGGDTGTLGFVGMVLGLHPECLAVNRVGTPLIQSYLAAHGVTDVSRRATLAAALRLPEVGVWAASLARARGGADEVALGHSRKQASAGRRARASRPFTDQSRTAPSAVDQQVAIRKPAGQGRSDLDSRLRRIRSLAVETGPTAPSRQS